MLKIFFAFSGKERAGDRRHWQTLNRERSPYWEVREIFFANTCHCKHISLGNVKKSIQL